MYKWNQLTIVSYLISTKKCWTSGNGLNCHVAIVQGTNQCHKPGLIEDFSHGHHAEGPHNHIHLGSQAASLQRPASCRGYSCREGRQWRGGPLLMQLDPAQACRLGGLVGLVLHTERQELKRLQEQPANSELHHMDQSFPTKKWEENTKLVLRFQCIDSSHNGQKSTGSGCHPDSAASDCGTYPDYPDSIAVKLRKCWLYVEYLFGMGCTLVSDPIHMNYHELGSSSW